ncbi:MAG: hypothetical protein QOJ29_2582 [Thermoleophilaceae bacterium]|nr:hypothetical protein [Thermoleophilaceae bacterium]
MTFGPNPLDEYDDDREFMKAMIEWTRDDVRQVYLRVTASLGIAVLFLTQLPFDKLAALRGSNKFCLLSGLAVLVVAAALHFLYLSKIHRWNRGQIAYLRHGTEAPLTTRASQVATHWQRTWARWKWAFLGGDALMALGVVLLAIALLGMLDLPTGKP